MPERSDLMLQVKRISEKLVPCWSGVGANVEHLSYESRGVSGLFVLIYGGQFFSRALHVPDDLLTAGEVVRSMAEQFRAFMLSLPSCIKPEQSAGYSDAGIVVNSSLDLSLVIVRQIIELLRAAEVDNHLALCTVNAVKAHLELLPNGARV